MSITELGAMGEFVSSIVILITLIAIYQQVRQQNRQNQAESNDSAMEGFSTVRSAVINNSEVAEIVAKLRDDPESVSGVDLIRANAMCNEVLWGLNIIHKRILLGMMPDYDLEYVEDSLNNYLQQPIYRQVWKENRSSFGNTQFARLIDDLVSSFEEPNSGTAVD